MSFIKTILNYKIKKGEKLVFLPFFYYICIMEIEVGIEELNDLNPFIIGTWSGLNSPLTKEEIFHAIEQQSFLDNPFNPELEWSRENHIKRIAYLVINGWDETEPLIIYNFLMGRLLMDGNHRFCAAIIKGYTKVKIKYFN